MPSPRVLDLSPTPNETWSNFGKSFTETLERNDTSRREEDIIKKSGYRDEEDPLKKLKLIEQAEGLSPERRKRERDQAIENADIKMKLDQYERNVTKADYEQKLGFIDKYHGEKYREASKALNTYLSKSQGLGDPKVIERLQQQKDDAYANLSGELKKHAPPGFFDKEEEQVAEAAPMEAPQAPQQQTGGRPKATAEDVDAKARQYLDTHRDETKPKKKKALTRMYVDSGEASLKAKRRAEEEITGRTIKPSKEEIKELEIKDYLQKRNQKEVDDFIKLMEYGDYAFGYNRLLGVVQEKLGVDEEKAMEYVLDTIEFDNVPDEEQLEVLDFFQTYTDDPAEIVGSLVKELARRNREYRGKK